MVEGPGKADGISRLVSVDIMKGLLVIGILFIHMLTFNADVREGGTMPTVLLMLYLGLMAFYIIAGYFYKPERTFRENMRRVLKLALALALTSLALPVIMYIWLTIFGQGPELSDLWDSILRAFWMYRLFEPMDGPLGYQMCYVNVINYYLWPMVAGLSVFFVLQKHVMDDWRKVAAIIMVSLMLQVVSATVYVKLPFFLQLCPIATAFIFLGASVSCYRIFERIEALEWRSPRYWVPFILSIVVGYLLCAFLPGGVKFDYMQFGDFGAWSVFPYFAEGTIITLMYAYLTTMLSKIPLLSSLLALSGRHSLGIVLYHILFAKMLIAPFYDFTYGSWFPKELDAMNLILIGLVTLVLCLVVSEYGNRLLHRTISRCRTDHTTS